MTDESGEPTETPAGPTSWRKDGRCSACAHFVADYGEPPELFGHCKMYPRQGAREAVDYACGEYKPLPGFAKLTESVSFEKRLEVDAAKGSRGSSSRSGRGRRIRRSAGPQVRLRRRNEDGSVVQSTRRAASEITPDVLAMFMGDDSEEATMDPNQLRDVLIDVVENFIGIEDVELGDKWHGGTVTLQPADPDLKPHVLDVEKFFHKVVMIRDRLRVMEQKINANDKLSDTEKVDLQAYISRCYGSLTTLNVLFKNKEDRFSSK